MAPPTHPRPTQDADERRTLEEHLDALRASVARTAAGLGTAQAVSRPLASTTLSIASLVKHLTAVERFWFSIDFAGADLPWPWTDDDRHGGFPVGPDDTIDGIVLGYLAECDRSRSMVAGSELGDLARGPDMHFTLRFAYVHMIEETARHCGHLDLLREAIDGTTGG